MKDLYEKYGISSPYGNRDGGFHYGVDIPTPLRQPLYAPADGRIAFEGDIPAAVAGWPKDRIIILQMSSSFIVFAHLDETVINTGSWVKEGQLIGYTGNSGYSFGPHLHAEERQGIKHPNQGFLAYKSIDITPRFKAQGGAPDMTVFIRPIQTLKAQFKQPIMMYNLDTNEAMWDSGLDAEFVAKTNIVHGSTFYITRDRWDAGEPFGFREQDIYAKGNKVEEVSPPANDAQARLNEIDQIIHRK